MKLRTLLVGTAVVTAGTALYLLMTSDDKKVTEETPFSQFSDLQETVDVLDSAYIAKWFKSIDAPQDAYCMVAYPTGKVLDKLGITGCPSAIDPGTNALLLASRKGSSDILATGLVSFGSVSDKVRALFGDEDFFIVEGE